ncbi:MAG TPA: serine--tRNA ligase, partial [Pirellulales bacterium]|nr:serine--tRNA ligase [Pirellulales bacterium]
MLDRKFIVDNAAKVKENCARRGARADVDRFVMLDAQRREKQSVVEELNRSANEVSKSIGKAKDAAEREARKAQGRELRDQTAAAQSELDALAAETDAIQRSIPNMSHPDAPLGADDQANLEVRRGSTPVPKFDFKPVDHLDLGERLDLLDFKSGAKVSGQGFYFLKNEAVLLELALQRYAVDLLIAEGFTPTITPDLARNEVLQGTGYIPRGPETQIYSVADSDLSLVATAEITLGGMLADEILEADQ